MKNGFYKKGLIVKANLLMLYLFISQLCFIQDVKAQTACHLSIVSTVVKPTCYGSCDGSISAVVSGGSGSYSYSWSNGATTSSISQLCSGTYTVTATDQVTACIKVKAIAVSKAKVSATTTNTPAHCGLCNGTITATGTGGNGGPYTYLWSTGATTSQITGVCPNVNYTLTVTDNLGCTFNCVRKVVNLGTTVSDNNPCTSDACDPLTGLTVYTLIPVPSDNNLCTTDACDGATGLPVYTPLPIVSDNNLCTTDACDGATGLPVYTPLPIVSDNNLCTTDGCDPATGLPTYVAIPIVGDNNLCTTDGCDPATGLPTHVAIPIVSDNNLCTTDGCDPATGLPTYVAIPIVSDNNLCTTDGCDPATGLPTYVAIPIVSDNNLCTTDGCDPATGLPTYVAIPIVSDNNLCTTDGCDPATGLPTYVAIPIVSDNNLCTTDGCDPATGLPTYVAIPIVSDNNLCTTDGCDPATGLPTHVANWGQDANLCTTESCDPATGNVSHTTNPIESDNNVCTTDNCDPVTGLPVYVPISGCGSNIILRKNPDVCEITAGVSTNVTFTYVVKNTGTSIVTSGTLVDDNGTPGNTADDINVCSWGPLNPGDSAVCTHVFTTTTSIGGSATANGSSGGSTVTATASAGVTAVNCTCNLNYPDNSNLPRSAVEFNESTVLRGSEPGPTACGFQGSVIKLWYSDEHALLLGVKRVDIKTSSGTSSTNYTVSSAPSAPGCLSNPSIGNTISSGDQAANDVADGGGRPLWPALFITDLTVNGATSRAGDWQQGGLGIPPHKVCGTWKAAVKLVDKTVNPPKVTITTDPDPAQNNWTLGSGSDAPTGGFAALSGEKYGAEVAWNTSDLGLIPGHDYRLQFMVHDGDQNKSGGDVGESCTIIHIPDANCITVTPPNGNSGNCPPDAHNPYTDFNATPNAGSPTSLWFNVHIKTKATDLANNGDYIKLINGKVTLNNIVTTPAISNVAIPSGKIIADNTVSAPVTTYDLITGSWLTRVPPGYVSSDIFITGAIINSSSGATVTSGKNSVISAALTSNKGSLTTNWFYGVACYQPQFNYSSIAGANVVLPVATSGKKTGTPTSQLSNLVAGGSGGGGSNFTGSYSSTELINICAETTQRSIFNTESTRSESLLAYPNPFDNNIKIELPSSKTGDAKIVITDVAGRIVEEFNHVNGTVLAGSSLNSGVYYITVTQDGASEVIKIVKQK